jgi:hypothetical protein
VVEAAVNSRITLILVILLAALGGYIYLFEMQSDEDESSRPDELLYDRAYGEYDIVELEILGPQGKAHFARTDQTLTQDWEMLQPNSLPPDRVDQVRVNGAATSLGHLTSSQVITGVADLAQYGLDPPDLTVTLTISDGQKITLLTGAETPVNDSRYLRIVDGDQSVYLVLGFAVDNVHRLLDEPPLKPTLSPTVTSP